MAGDLTLRLRITGDARQLEATVVDATTAIDRIGPAATESASRATTALDALETAAREAASAATTAAEAAETIGPSATVGAAQGERAMEAMEAAARALAAAAAGSASAVEQIGASATAGAARGQRAMDALDAAARGVAQAAAGSAAAVEQIGVEAAAGAARGQQAMAVLEAAARSVAAAADAAAAAQQRVGPAVVGAAAPAGLALGQLARGHQSAAVASAGLARQTGVTAYQMAQLTPQINDVVTSLAMGMPPLMVLTQQGTQITQVFGGPIATMRAFAMALGVTGIAAIGVGTVLGVVGGHALRLEQQQRSLATALAGTGRTAVASTAQLQAYVRALEHAGAADAAGIVTRLARTRGLSGADIGRVAGLAPDLAAALGTDAADAADQLVAAMTRGYAAVAKLDDQLGALTATEREQIRTLLEAGERTRALALLTDTLASRLGGLARDAMGPTALAMRDLSRNWSAFMDSVSRSEPVILALRYLNEAVQGLGLMVNGAPARGGPAMPGDAEEDEAAALWQRRQELMRRYQQLANPPVGRPHAAVLAPMEAELGRLDAQIEALRKRRDQLRAPAPQGATGTPGGSGTSAADADDLLRQRTAMEDLTQSWRDQQRVLAVGITQRDAMRARIVAEREAQERGITGAAREELIRRRVAEATRGQATAAADNLVAMTAETAAAIAAAQAAEQGRAAMMRATAAADAHARAATEAGTNERALAQALLNRNAAQIATGGAEQLLQLREQADSTERIGAALRDGFHAGRVAEVEERVRQLTAQLLAAAEASDDPRLQSLLRGLAGSVGAQVRREDAGQGARQLQEMLLGQRQDTESLRLRSQLLGRWGSRGADAEQLADLRAVHELERARLPVVGRLAEEYRAQARAIAGLTIEVERQQAAWDEVGGVAREAMAGVGQQIQRDIAEGTLGLRTLEKVGLSVAQTLINKFAELAIINPIMNAVFGGGAPTLAGLFGGGGAGLPPMPSASGFLMGATYHTGGIVGAGAANRMLPASLFAQAPRLHGGGFIGPGEVPAILKAGEGVFTPEQMAALGGNQVSISIAFSGDAGSPADRRRLQAMVAEAVDQGIARRMPAIAAASNASLLGQVRRGGDTARTLGRA